MQTTVESTPVPTNLDDLQRLFEAHHERVFRAAYRVTGNAADAEDVLQSVFLRLLRLGHDFRDIEDAANYLYRAGVNAAVDVLRSRKAVAQVPLGDAFANGREPAGAPHPGEQDAHRELLRVAVGRLHPTAAEMFVLRYFEGYENAEVARLMNTTEGTVAVTLHRTRARLQKELTPVR